MSNDKRGFWASNEGEAVLLVLRVLPVIVLNTVATMLLSFVMGAIVFIELISVYSFGKYPAEAVSLLITVGTYCFICKQPQIRSYISPSIKETK